MLLANSEKETVRCAQRTIFLIGARCTPYGWISHSTSLLIRQQGHYWCDFIIKELACQK